VRVFVCGGMGKHGLGLWALPQYKVKVGPVSFFEENNVCTGKKLK